MLPLPSRHLIYCCCRVVCRVQCVLLGYLLLIAGIGDLVQRCIARLVLCCTRLLAGTDCAQPCCCGVYFAVSLSELPPRVGFCCASLPLPSGFATSSSGMSSKPGLGRAILLCFAPIRLVPPTILPPVRPSGCLRLCGSHRCVALSSLSAGPHKM